MISWLEALVDKAVGIGAFDAFGVLGQVQVGVDGIEAHPGAGAGVGGIGDEPEALGPGHQRADAVFAARDVAGGDGEVGKDAADVRIGGGIVRVCDSA